tara:strand:- start:55 stop:618 length:564 start_codon:yes stop_codon:yes gene_type:complete
MKKLFIFLILLNISSISYSQDNKNGNSILNKINENTKDGNLKDALVNIKEDFLEDKINELVKEIEGLNKNFESDFSNYVDKLLKENRNYLDQLENEYRSKLKEEYDKVSELKKNVDELQKIKDLELKIVDKKIDEINKNLKKLSSDDFIKDFKKDLKKQLDKFKKSTIESFENELNIKVDTTRNEKN